MRPFFFLLAATLLAGCATPHAPQEMPNTHAAHQQALSAIRTFALQGRIAVLTEKKGFSGLMRWHHHNEGDEISFYSPLGTQLGQISVGPEGVTLTTSDRKIYSAENAEALTEQALGWSLPLSGLPDWVLGRPTRAEEAHILAWDAAGHIQRMQQQGWDIAYSHYTEVEGRMLPGKILMKSRTLDLKLVIEQWIGLQEAE